MSRKGWRYIDATTFCTKVTDGTHDSPKRKEFGKPLITSKHIKGRSIDFENAYFISEEDFNKINQRSKVDQWDVIISMIGEYCGFCYVERNPVIDYAVKNVGLLKTGNKTKADWLYYFINSPEGKNYLASLKSGTSQPYLSLGALRSLPILIPESEREMESIVSILSVLDDKIELNHQTNATLEATAQAIFKEWFVDSNFPGATGEMVESELGMIPRGWRLSILGEEGDFKNGVNYSRDENGDAEFHIVNVRNIVESKFIDKQHLDKIQIDEKKGRPYLLEANDILIVRSASPGETAILLQSEDGIIYSGFTIRYRLNDKQCFLYLFFIFQNIKNKLESLANGTTLKNVNQEMLRPFKIIIPDAQTIHEFNLQIRPVFQKIQNNIHETNALISLRDELLPKLLSGEIEV